MQRVAGLMLRHLGSQRGVGDSFLDDLLLDERANTHARRLQWWTSRLFLVCLLCFGVLEDKISVNMRSQNERGNLHLEG